MPTSYIDPFRLGLLQPQNGDVTRSPIPMAVARKPNAKAGSKKSGDQPAQTAPASAYTPDGVLKSQNDLAGYFQSLPTAQVVGGGGLASAAGWAGNIGKGFMSTYLPTQAEKKMLENQRLTTQATNDALAAATPQERARIMGASGVPALQNQALTDTNPQEVMRLKLQEEELNIKRAAAAAAARREAQEAEWFGGGGTTPAQTQTAPAQAIPAHTQPTMQAPDPFYDGAAAQQPSPPMQGYPSPQSIPQQQQQQPDGAAAATPAPTPEPLSNATLKEVLSAMPPAERAAMGVLFRSKPEEFAKAIREKVDQSAPTTPAGRARIAEKFGLSQDHPAYKPFILTGKMPREDQSLSAHDKTVIEKAEADYLKSQNAIGRMQVAKSYNPQTHSGWGADLRATLGNNLPDYLVPDALASPESSKATRTYTDIMSQEAVKQMGDDLTGASTDFEMRKYMEIVADVSKPREIRQEAMDRMIEAGERHKRLMKNRIEDIRGGTYYGKNYRPDLDNIGQQAAPQPAAGAAPAETKSIDGKAYVKRDGKWYPQ